MKPEVNNIERQAAGWAARTNGDELSEQEQLELDAWLAADVRNLGAYLRASAAVLHLKRHRLAALQAARRSDRSSIRRRVILGGAIAASIAAVAIIGGGDWGRRESAVYETEIGQTKTVSLPDGSTATLNTRSTIVANYSRDARSISLKSGEVLFYVKPDRSRPFVVAVGKWKVRAVGTDFVVSAFPSEPLKILVQKGVVALESLDLRSPTSINVAAGSRAVVADASAIKVERLSPQEIARELAWREGLIFFRHRTLGSAAKEFARYNTTSIVFDDPAVANLMITGSFHSNDPIGFVKAAALSLNLNATVTNKEAHLTRKP